MKATTQVFARFESKGYPRLTVTNDTPTPIREIMAELANWILMVPMNKKIVVTFSVDREGLETTTKGMEVDSMMDMLNGIMDQDEFPSIIDHIDPEGLANHLKDIES